METLVALIQQYGLLFVFFNVLMLQAGLPVPAYPTLIITGALAATGGASVPALVAVAVIAALIADLCWYAAGRKFGSSVEYVDLADIPAVFEEVVRGHIDYGLVPVENSIHGGVIDTLDAFLQSSAKICAEVKVTIHHNLLAKEAWDHVKRIYSKPEVFTQCRKWLGMRYGVETHEDWYSAISPKIMVEEYLADAVHGVPLDYKFWVFHGVVEFVQVDLGRFSNHTRSMYDRRWNRQPWSVHYPLGPDVQRPKSLDRMIEMAECLAVDIDPRRAC